MTGREDLERVVAEADLIEHLCELMHDAYEAAAVEAGWETNARSRVPWADVPEANKATMRKAVAVIAPLIEQARRDGAVEALREAGPKLARMRHTASGRRVANAEWLGEVVWAMADDMEWQAERRYRAERAAQTPQQFAQGVGRGEVDPESAGSDRGPQIGGER